MLLSVLLTVFTFGIAISEGKVCYLISFANHGRMAWAFESGGSSECTQITIGGYLSSGLLPAEVLVFDNPCSILTAGENVQKILNRTRTTDTTTQLAHTSQPSTWGSSKADESIPAWTHSVSGEASSGTTEATTQMADTVQPSTGSSKADESTLARTDAISGEASSASLTCSWTSKHRTNTTYYYRYLEIPTGTRRIEFEAKANNDVFIALSPSESSPDLYEILIGGWNNARSAIRSCKQCTEKTAVETNHYLSKSEFRKFWITFESNGTIAVGREHESTPFMEWTDSDPLDIHYLGYSTGWGSHGVFRFCILG